MDTENKGVVLLVDDDASVLDATSMLLGMHGYRVIACDDSADALSILDSEEVDMMLTDIKMPRVSGMELLGRARSVRPLVPVVLMTGYADMDIAMEAIKKGAFDLILKPYRAEYLLLNVNRAIEHSNLLRVEKRYKEELERTVARTTEKLRGALKALKDSSLETISRLTGAAEFRDMDTGEHISRVGLYAGRIAQELGMPTEFVETITFASPMHDIGKIGIPDSILLKEGPLSEAEFEIMKTHTMIGHKLLAGSTHANIRMAATVALTHHERWDGSGYPRGLKGEEIPVEGMITMLCDQYDALRSRRPYKEPMGHEHAVSVITVGNVRSRVEHFHPGVLDAFVRLAPEFDRIFLEHRETADGIFETGVGLLG
ncbi:MAG: HD-GYP domain-containing protein [Thermodesulfobacteriota bacterium]